jgi:hypothetical protein
MVTGSLRPIVYCHCSMCRRATGHFVAATACHESRLHITGSDHLRWYQSSGLAKRGFCDICGSNLFWKPTGDSRMCIWAGSLNSPTGLKAVAHIFVDEKGDYYNLNDELPQYKDGTQAPLRSE